MIEKVQRQATRFVFNDYSYNSSVTDMLSKLQWDSLELRHKKISPTHMFYKSIYNQGLVSQFLSLNGGYLEISLYQG